VQLYNNGKTKETDNQKENFISLVLFRLTNNRLLLPLILSIFIYIYRNSLLIVPIVKHSILTSITYYKKSASEKLTHGILSPIDIENDYL
jgi:hypothetical protein